ncbi:MAG: alpha/beta family hydrolase [Longimicrobiales bacterium]
MAEVTSTDHRFLATDSSGEVSGLLLRPRDAWAIYVFAHGAGADMRHAFMSAVAERLAGLGIASFRYNFPYMEKGRGGPNPAPVLVKTVRSAVSEATRLVPGIPLLAGGKSMGGRMTSTAAAAQPLAGVLGLAFFGFPLHAPGKASSQRGAHLTDVSLPMLFLQGTRDKLADLELLRPLVGTVKPTPKLHVVDQADHGFHVPKRSGRTDEGVLDELCAVFAEWARGVVGRDA